MHPARPAPELVPCAACGVEVDALRAARVIAFEDGVEYPCSEVCAEAIREGARRARPVPVDESSLDGGAPGPAARVRRAPLPTQRPLSAASDFDVPTLPWPGIVLTLTALVTAFISTPPWVAYLSAIASILAGALAIRATVPAWKGIGWLPWIAAPAGAIVAALSGLMSSLEGSHDWLALAGAAVGAAMSNVRLVLDAQARQPIADAANRLLEALPRRVRIPIEDPSSAVATEHEVVTDRVRAGEEVVARSGDAIGVDGIVKGGEATVLPYPSARVGIVRRAGDPVLAGAKVVSGAVRVLAMRVGDERALVKPQRFGLGTGPNAARTARLAEQAARWGGIATVVLSIGGLVLASQGGPEGPLAAAAAVLLVTPLLAVRRAADASLVAAAAAAADRGIVFQTARVLETAGRVHVAALCSHGTVTEGVPEVADVHPIDGTDTATLIALAAAAQTAAEQSSIALAIRRYAGLHHIVPESVRRAVYLPGRGVTALSPGGEPFVIGNRQLLLDEGVSVAVADAEAARIEHRGHTALFIGLGGRVRALLSLHDPVRAGARAAVQRIFDLHIEAVLLSGDHRGTAEAIARTLDVDHVKAELLPEERGEEVRRQREAGSVVACCGLLAHDEGALAAADVPIVLGAAGGATSDASVAIATDDVRDAATALFIAKAARAEALRSVVAAIAAGATMVAASALGFVPPLVAALVGIAIDAFALPAGARLLRRIELRIPTQRAR